PGWIPNPSLEISHESPGSSQCLLEHLLTRLQSSSCHVKLKVLKILLHTCSQGSPQFVLQLKRNANFIREAAVFSGPPDPLHGNSLNQKVRAAAEDLASILFSDAPLPQPLALSARPPAPAGMGSSPSPCGSLQGFGFSSDKSGSASTGEALLSSLQRAAEAVAQAVLPVPGGARRLRGDLPEDTYEPVRAPPPASSPAVPPPTPPAPRGARGGSCRSSQGSLGAPRPSRGVWGAQLSSTVPARSMCAISALGCSDLLSPEQIFAVTQQRLQHLSQGSPGPVANRATKMLRQFEALCRAQPSPRAPRPPSAPSVGSAGDLLMDIPALASESFLTPLSPAPTPAAPTAPGEEPGVASEPPGQPGAAVPACPCEQDGGSRLAGDTAAPSLSLFAGMELVACPGTVLRPHSAPLEPQTPSQPQDGGTDTEGTLQPSAFAFLNM
ncbi:AP4AT protein, partial [Pomatorhinus ruficollis]|nr:AP4AT protein [Pomatorhinus ruficollis]